MAYGEGNICYASERKCVFRVFLAYPCSRKLAVFSVLPIEMTASFNLSIVMYRNAITKNHYQFCVMSGCYTVIAFYSMVRNGCRQITESKIPRLQKCLRGSTPVVDPGDGDMLRKLVTSSCWKPISMGSYPAKYPECRHTSLWIFLRYGVFLRRLSLKWYQEWNAGEYEYFALKFSLARSRHIQRTTRWEVVFCCKFPKSGFILTVYSSVEVRWCFRFQPHTSIQRELSTPNSNWICTFRNVLKDNIHRH